MNDGIVIITILAWLAYLASRIFRRRELPELVAFLAVGAAAGPSGFGLISHELLTDLEPVLQIALAVLMFIIGERVSIRALRASKWIGIAGSIQYVLCGVAVFAVAEWLGASRAVSVMLAVLAGAGAPMTMASLVISAKAKGSYASGIVGAHAVGDALASIFFAVALPVAVLLTGPDDTILEAVFRFLRLGAGGALVGLIGGVFIGKYGQQIETSGELLLFAVIHILVAGMVSTFLGVSLPLAALVMGSVAASLAKPDAAQRLFVAVRGIEQPLYLIFFALAGASIHLDAIPRLGLLGVGYIVARLAGKMAGGFLGGMLGGLGPSSSFRLGVDLIPQAGVAVGLAVLAIDILPGPGSDMATVVLGSVVFFEIVGPLLVSRGFRREKPKDEKSSSQDVYLGHAPTQILIASPAGLEIPSWVIDMCARTGAGLTAMGRSDESSAEVKSLREAAGSEVVAFRWIPMRSESFVGAVVRTTNEIKADLVVVLTPVAEYQERSRLMLHPHERVARQLTCPVILIPYSEGSEIPSADRPG